MDDLEIGAAIRARLEELTHGLSTPDTLDAIEAALMEVEAMRTEALDAALAERREARAAAREATS